MKAATMRVELVVRALLIWIYLYGAALLLASATLQNDVRPFYEEAATAHAIPFLLMLAVTLPLFHLLRGRFKLPDPLPRDAPDRLVRRLYVSAVLVMPFLTFLCSMDEFAPEALIDPSQWPATAASATAVLAIAATEEMKYRWALMGLLIRARLPAVLVLLVQAAVFVLAHKRQAFASPDAMLKYATGALTLGAIYLASRSLLAPIALHFSVDTLLAQTAPQFYWIAPRLVESVHWHWFHACTWGFILAGTSFLAWIAFKRAATSRLSLRLTRHVDP